MKETGISQAKLAPMMNLSGAVLSQYRRSVYDKGDVEDVERKIREFFQIKEEQAENAKKTESFNAVRGYVATSISESIYKMIRYCQLEKGIVVIDGDAGIGKTKAATKFLRDNPATAIYISTTPSTSSVRSLLRMIARALKISENQRTEDLSISIRERLRSSDNVLIIDEAQNLKFMACLLYTSPSRLCILHRLRRILKSSAQLYSTFIIRYPTPIWVWIYWGESGSLSSFLRRVAINTRREAISLSQLLPHTFCVI